MSSTDALIAAGILLIAGVSKGVFGMGLPAISLGLLSLVMAPVEAAMLIVVPTLATNAWQFLTGPRRFAMMRRFGALLVGVVIGTTIGISVLTGAHTTLVSLALGSVLTLYGIAGLVAGHWTIASHAERWCSPAIGVLTGLMNGATGVSVMPLVPYLGSIGLARDELIQAMGLVFMTAMVALASCLAWTGHLRVASAGASMLALVPVFAGMHLGQMIRLRLHADAFRKWLFIGLLALGGYSVVRALTH
jgi:uncharacterized membrane protein YfcA